MLSNLNRDLKAELSYLHEILASEPKQENRISTEYSINQPCNSFNVEVVDNLHENYKEHKFKVQDPLKPMKLPKIHFMCVHSTPALS